MERRRESLYKLAGNSEQKVGEVRTRLIAVKVELPVGLKIDDLFYVVDMRIHAGFQGVRAHGVRDRIRQLIGVIKLTQRKG